MAAQKNAESAGLVFTKTVPGYLNLCIQSRGQLFTSGHVSDTRGKLGQTLSTEQGYAAARDCAAKVLNSVWNRRGTLDGLRVVRLLGCVNSAADYTDQHLVVNGASDLLHQIFGTNNPDDPDTTALGYHARSALGFASLPTGAAVEVEAIFEVLDEL